VIDRLVHKRAAEIAARRGSAVEDVVDAVYGSLESGLLRLVRQNGSSLRIEPCGDVAARRAAREANRRLMKVLRARMPDGHAFED
jgi:hypothetical protein